MCMPSRMMDGAPQPSCEESPVPLLSETRPPALPTACSVPIMSIAAEGTANLFLFVQPLRGWRHVNVTAHRTKHDFAVQMQELVDVHCPEADVIRLVVDNLNTYDTAALYETFGNCSRSTPDHAEVRMALYTEAWQLATMAACACAVLTEQCLDRRIPQIAMLCQEITARQAARKSGQPSEDQLALDTLVHKTIKVKPVDLAKPHVW